MIASGRGALSLPKTRGEAIVLALPGTAKCVAAKTGISLRIVRKILRGWLRDGKVRRSTLWYDQHSYTWLYERP